TSYGRPLSTNRFSHTHRHRQVKIADAFRRRRIAQKLTCKKVEIGGGTRKMRGKGVVENETRLIAHKPGCTQVARTNLNTREIVDAIVNRTPPVKRHLR